MEMEKYAYIQSAQYPRELFFVIIAKDLVEFVRDSCTFPSCTRGIYDINENNGGIGKVSS